jgi:hypothetical protein
MGSRLVHVINLPYRSYRWIPVFYRIRSCTVARSSHSPRAQEGPNTEASFRVCMEPKRSDSCGWRCSMRVRVGQFERIGHPAGDTAPFAFSSDRDSPRTVSKAQNGKALKRTRARAGPIPTHGRRPPTTAAADQLLLLLPRAYKFGCECWRRDSLFAKHGILYSQQAMQNHVYLCAT